LSDPVVRLSKSGHFMVHLYFLHCSHFPTSFPIRRPTQATSIQARWNKWAVSHPYVTYLNGLGQSRAGSEDAARDVESILGHLQSWQAQGPLQKCYEIARYELADNHDVAINVNISLLQQEVLRYKRWKNL
jgi:hypothetical protein